MLSTIAAFFTFFVVSHYLGREIFSLIVKRLNIVMDKERVSRFVSMIVDTLMAPVTIGFSLWYTIVAWNYSKDIIPETAIYLFFCEANAAFFLSSMIMDPPGPWIMIHHLTALFSSLAVLEENRLTWYYALGNLNDITFLFFAALYTLYHTGKGNTLLYKVVRGFRLFFWITIRTSLVVISITKTSIDSYPNIDLRYNVLLIVASVLITIYNISIVVQDILYFYRLIKQ